MAADVEYGVFVGETQVTSGNAADVLGNGKVSYDAGSNTLKLDGAVVGSIIFNAVSEDASVEFTGDNTVGGVIVSMGRLTLKGSGTLEIVYDGAEAMTAVAAMSNINFESGTVNIKCANGYSIHTTYDVNVWGTAVVNIDHQADSEAVYVNGTLNVSDRGPAVRQKRERPKRRQSQHPERQRRQAGGKDPGRSGQGPEHRLPAEHLRR